MYVCVFNCVSVCVSVCVCVLPGYSLMPQVQAVVIVCVCVLNCAFVCVSVYVRACACVSDPRIKFWLPLLCFRVRCTPANAVCACVHACVSDPRIKFWLPLLCFRVRCTPANAVCACARLIRASSFGYFCCVLVSGVHLHCCACLCVRVCMRACLICASSLGYLCCVLESGVHLQMLSQPTSAVRACCGACDSSIRSGRQIVHTDADL